jgi:uncharacterized membrane protein YesL
MREPVRALWQGLAVFERYGHVFVVANLLAVLVSLPLITAPAALAGLARLAYSAHTGPAAHIDDFWAGFRANLGRGLLVALANVAVFGILWVNFSSYSQQSGAIFDALRFMWLIILVIWVCAQLYLWPILEAMERPALHMAYFNAGLMTLKNPFYSIVLLVGIAIIVLISTATVVPWALLTFSLIASIATAAVLDRLRAATPGSR